MYQCINLAPVYIKQLISLVSYESSVDSFCTINNGNEFLTSFKNIYKKKSELNFEHQGNRGPLLYSDIEIEKGYFVYKLFELYFIRRMPHLSSNVPSTIFMVS